MMLLNSVTSMNRALQIDLTVIPSVSGLCWTREQIIILLLNELIVVNAQWTFMRTHICTDAASV